MKIPGAVSVRKRPFFIWVPEGAIKVVFFVGPGGDVLAVGDDVWEVFLGGGGWGGEMNGSG